MKDEEVLGLFLVAVILSGIFMLVELGKINKYASWYLGLIPLFLLLSILGFNRTNRDYEAYETAFVDDWYRSQLESGYGKMVEILRDFGYNHTAIVFLVGILFMMIILKYLKGNNHINLVIFFYCLFPLVYDINQTRNTIMYFLVILSLIFVIKEKPIKHYITLLIALSMHSFAILYTPFYFLTKINRKTFIKIMVISTLSLFVLSPIVIQILTHFFPYKMSVYLDNRPRFGQFILFLYAFVDIFTVWWIDKKISPRLKDEADKRKMEILYRFVWFPIIVLPFSFYFITVMRLQRNALLIKYIFSALAMRYMTVKEKLITVLLLVISLMFYVFLLGDLEIFKYLNENGVQYYIEKYILY